MKYNLLDQNIGRYAILNHQLIELNTETFAYLEKYQSNEQFYEIIRCVDGVPMFLNDHIERLLNSAEKIMPDPRIIQNDVIALMKAERLINGNIKIVMASQLCLIFSSRYYYPNNHEYRKGVFVGLLTLERCDPNVKVVRPDYKETVRMKLDNPGPLGPYFETLLVASSGEITEGSRSNVFFIDGETIRTAPADKILEGITRKYVLKAIDACGFRILPEAIRVQDLNKNIKAAFLTGTSIGILPVGAIEDQRLFSGENAVIQQIRSEYDRIFWGHYRENLKKFVS